MSDRADRLRIAFERGSNGDRRGAMADFRPDYVHHSVMGDIQGLETYFEQWLPIFEAIDLKQEVREVVEHGPFVIVTVQQTSSVKAETTSGVHIYRWEGDQIAELWSLVDPS